MNFKRKRPKNRRAGCLMCKPHKANGACPRHKDMRMGDLRKFQSGTEQLRTMLKYSTVLFALAIWLTPISAKSEAPLGTGLATIVIYDSQCRPIPKMMRILQQILNRDLPSKAAFDAALPRLMREYRADPAQFCVTGSVLLRRIYPKEMAE